MSGYGPDLLPTECTLQKRKKPIKLMSFLTYRSETLTTTALYTKSNMWPVQGQYPKQIYLHIFQ